VRAQKYRRSYLEEFPGNLEAASRTVSCPPEMADYPHQVIGRPPIETEAGHFIHCPCCGTWIDCRSLGELLEHEDWCSCDHHTTSMPSQGPQ
jgi:hypothetical protein